MHVVGQIQAEATATVTKADGTERLTDPTPSTTEEE
jgi:hypothetical protein